VSDSRCPGCGSTDECVSGCQIDGLRKLEEGCVDRLDYAFVVVDLQRKLATAHKLLRRANAALSVAGRGIREGVEHADLTTDIELFLIDTLKGGESNDGT
jgi:hypothetical protein